MNEIEKLKAEHARYEKALQSLLYEHGTHSLAYKAAYAALNPPPPAPVTLDELKSALNRYNEVTPEGGFYSINFFRDESGSIRDGNESRVFSFSSLREAVDWLTRLTR